MATTLEAPPPRTEDPTEGGGNTPGEPVHPPLDPVTRIIAGGDHKTTGRLYLGFSLVFALLGLLATVAYQAPAANEAWETSFKDAAFQFLTLGRLLLVFGFVIPLFIGLGTLLVPLQVGSTTLAYPRAAAAAFWLWLVGTSMLIICYLSNGGIAGGNKDAQMLALLSIAMVVIALLLGSICVAVTAIGLRAPNMKMDDVPMFTWSSVVAASVWLLTLPVWLGNLVLIFLDVRYSQPASFGAVDDQWAQLAWPFSPPQIFAFVIPVLGIACDVAVTFSGGQRLRRRGTVLTAIGAFGFLAMGAAVQPYFIPGVYRFAPVIVQMLLLVVPVLIILGSFVNTIMHSSRKATSPVFAAGAAMVLLLVAWLGAAVFVVGPFSLGESPKLALPAVDLALPTAAPMFTWAIFFLVLGTALTGAIGGTYLWSSKITGRTIGEGGGFILVLITLLGALAASLPLAALGFGNRWDIASSTRPMLAVSTLGVVALLIVVIGLGAALLVSAQRSTRAADDPWGTGQTLEWVTASPPEPDNFSEVPKVSSPEPVLDLTEQSES